VLLPTVQALVDVLATNTLITADAGHHSEATATLACGDQRRSNGRR
jgi:hypothetical protein